MARAKQELCRDIVGRTVELGRDITTVGGATYAKGSRFVVSQTHRGRFTLSGGPIQVRRSDLARQENVAR